MLTAPPSALQNGDRFSCVGPCHVDIPGSNAANPSSAYRVVKSWEVYDYGNSELDVRHRVAVTLSYDLPFAQSKTGAEGILLKGWSTNVLYFYQTGEPFTVENNTPVGGTSDGFTNTTDRPNVFGPMKAAHPTLAQYFNTANIVQQAGGTLGDEGKNPVYGPRITALNFSVFKTFTLRENLKFQFRSEFFNLANTPSFNPPSNQLGASTFGQTTSTVPGATPRQIQFAAKLLF